jgi:GTPase SAR1 family protein
VRVQVVVAMGGVGKTTLANEYAHRHWQDYREALWVDARRGCEAEFALAFERVWRRIDWRDMDRIEKRFVPVEGDGEGGFTPSYEVIRFKSGRRTIPVRSTIVGYEALKRCVTDQAKRRGIEIVAVEPQPLCHAPHITRLDEL